MKKVYSFLLVVLLAFSFPFMVNAEEDTTCNYKSKSALQKSAYNVDANYMIRKDENNNYYFAISIYNITDDIYAIITNDINDEEIQVTNLMTENNNYTFTVNDTTTVINYVIHIRGIKYGCNDELRKINLTKPRYNDLSEIAVCKDDVMLDYNYCKTWVDKYFTETREEVIEKINRNYQKNIVEATTKCISCEKEQNNDKKIKKQQMMRIAVIVGLIIAILLDGAVIYLLIMRLKRYEE